MPSSSKNASWLTQISGVQNLALVFQPPRWPTVVQRFRVPSRTDLTPPLSFPPRFPRLDATPIPSAIYSRDRADVRTPCGAVTPARVRTRYADALLGISQSTAARHSTQAMPDEMLSDRNVESSSAQGKGLEVRQGRRNCWRTGQRAVT